MNNVMVDLETLGITPGSVILSIGAVAFDLATKQLGKEFYVVIDTPSCLDYGLTTDNSTLQWWQNQSDDARKVLDQAKSIEFSKPLYEALLEFDKFLTGFDINSVQIWGNGSDFDNAMLTCAYAAIDRNIPWKFWNNRCFRTVRSLFPEKHLDRIGTFHNALDDAKTQANHLIKIMNHA